MNTSAAAGSSEPTEGATAARLELKRMICLVISLYNKQFHSLLDGHEFDVEKSIRKGVDFVLVHYP